MNYFCHSDFGFFLFGYAGWNGDEGFLDGRTEKASVAGLMLVSLVLQLLIVFSICPFYHCCIFRLLCFRLSLLVVRCGTLSFGLSSFREPQHPSEGRSECFEGCPTGLRRCCSSRAC